MAMKEISDIISAFERAGQAIAWYRGLRERFREFLERESADL